MNNPGVNILDLLLNPALTKPELVLGEALTPAEGSPLFGDIMAGLLAPNGIPAVDGQANPVDAAAPFVLEQLLGVGTTATDPTIVGDQPTVPPADLQMALIPTDADTGSEFEQSVAPTALDIVPAVVRVRTDGESKTNQDAVDNKTSLLPMRPRPTTDIAVRPEVDLAPQVAAEPQDVNSTEKSGTDGVLRQNATITPSSAQPAETDNAFPQAEQVSDKVLAFNRDLLSMLPEQRIVQNESLRDILSNVAVDLEPGQYRIIDSRQVGQSLQMEIAPDESGSQSIKLTLPMSTLTQKNEAAAAASRVTLTITESTRSDFQRLVSGLDLKQIEIAAVDDETVLTGKSAEVTIVANDGTRRVILEGRTTNLDARIAKTEATVGKAAVPVMSENAGRESADPLGLISARAATTPEQQTVSPVAGETSRLTLADVLGRPAGPNTEVSSTAATADSVTSLGESSAGESGDLAGGLHSNLSQMQASDHTTGQTGQARPVIFHLPDNIQTALKNHRQSITIKIEPEHLGPARLSLVERSGGLQASLVVDSHEAKALVESSLDKLTRQLEKADIKISSIEVSVGGEANHRQGFERRTNWQRSGQWTRLTDSANNDLMGSAAVTMPPRGYEGYAGAGGVNLLA